MKHGFRRGLLVLVFLLLGIVSLLEILRERSRASVLNERVWKRAEFLEQKLDAGLYEQILGQAGDGVDFGDLLTVLMLKGNFSPDVSSLNGKDSSLNENDTPGETLSSKKVSLAALSADRAVYLKYKRREYLQMKACYEAVWADLEYFPVASADISFKDSYGEARSYGGDRLHEGCDLFGTVNKSGYYPVISMTDGVVEKIGWLPLGGYRIGVRSPSGGYFYYAHLSGYEQDFTEGQEISAGDILGYMGDTGYGTEGTRGKFPVHLHLGIYIQTPENPEQSVNPYYVLLAVYKKIRKYRY